MFRDGQIEDVVVRPLKVYEDGRGWLVEIFRQDETPVEFLPVMGYVSMTGPGVARGPHEHEDQADNFCFLGPSTFRIYLWDNRRASRSFGTKQVIIAGVGEPKAITVPKGVVHAYKNIGDTSGMVVNCPNRLFAGRGKTEPVDEIRHEDDPSTPFRLDEVG